MADMVMVFMNSARKNRPKRMDEYSVWNPPTSSCSASVRSNGGRVSSAVMAIMKKTKGRKPEPDQVPVPEAVGLRGHDGPGGERAAHQHDHHRRHAERRLVGDDLGRGAHRSEQRVLRSRGPSGQHHAVHRDARHGEDEEDPHGRVGHLQLEGVAADGDHAADRDHGEDEHGGDHRQVRGELEDEGVRPVGQQVLLEHELGAVGQRLEQPPRAGPVRSDPALHVRDHLALEPDHERRRHQQRHEGHEALDDHDEPDLPVRGRRRRAGRRCRCSRCA